MIHLQIAKVQRSPMRFGYDRWTDWRPLNTLLIKRFRSKYSRQKLHPCGFILRWKAKHASVMCGIRLCVNFNEGYGGNGNRVQTDGHFHPMNVPDWMVTSHATSNGVLAAVSFLQRRPKRLRSVSLEATGNKAIHCWWAISARARLLHTRFSVENKEGETSFDSLF